MKRCTPFLAVILLLLVAGIAVAAPTAMVKVMGVSPRDVAKDTTDIYTKSSTGLPNVGVGELVYLAGNAGDTSITAWEWTLNAPAGSASALSSADKAVVTLTPDKVGTFTVTLKVTNAEGTSEPVDLKINSATYIGVGGVAGDPAFPECAICHAAVTAKWAQTNHATALSKVMDGEGADHFAARCVSCHSTGYEAGAENGGFADKAADEGWVLPPVDSLKPGGWDKMKAGFPNTAKMANVQCESCHGPGSAHVQGGQKVDNKMVSNLMSDACAKCHDSGSHHVLPYQWDNSGHGNPVDESGRADCAKCHVGGGFIDYINGVPDSLARTDYVPISCATCHDPHSADNAHQVRTSKPVTLMNGVEYDHGAGNLCANCHRSRRDVRTYVNKYASRFGPHYGAQAEMIQGTGGVEYDKPMQSSPHGVAVEGSCVGCHLAPTPASGEPGYLTVGGHSFRMKDADGNENVGACITCHPGITKFEDIKPAEDWDGDQQIESVMDEIKGLMTALAMKLPPVGEDKVTVTAEYTPEQLKAAYNYLLCYYDHSYGMHNAKYARSILQASLDTNLGVETVEGPAPMKFELGSAYPNPFNPSTTLNYSVAKNGLVTIAVFDMTGRRVQTVTSSEHKAGTYRTLISMGNQPSGVYMVSMVADGFKATKKIVLVK